MSRRTCAQPARDVPKLMCGYPIPCPWHTAIIDITTKPATVTIPVTATAALESRRELADAAEALSEEES